MPLLYYPLLRYRLNSYKDMLICLPARPGYFDDGAWNVKTISIEFIERPSGMELIASRQCVIQFENISYAANAVAV